jgi:hypothetical protein
MAGKPQNRPMQHDRKSTGEPEHEPRARPEMSLMKNGGSVTVSIPAFAVKLCGYEVGETRHVEVYDDGVWIPRQPPDGVNDE